MGIKKNIIIMAIVFIALVSISVFALETKFFVDVNMLGNDIYNVSNVNTTNLSVTGFVCDGNNCYTLTELNTTINDTNETLRVNALVLNNITLFGLIDSLNTSKLNVSDQRYNDTLLIDALNSSKLDVGDQRYNESGLIDALNSSKLDKTDQRYNETSLFTSLNNSKLDKTDQRYNETSLIDAVNASYTPVSDSAPFFVNRTDWTTIDDYPSACSAGDAVTGIGDTLSCTTFLQSESQLVYSSIVTDSGTISADTTSDTASIIGGGVVSTSASADTITVTVTDQWVDESGDTMTGDLNLSNNRLIFDGFEITTVGGRLIIRGVQ